MNREQAIEDIVNSRKSNRKKKKIISDYASFCVRKVEVRTAIDNACGNVWMFAQVLKAVNL